MVRGPRACYAADFLLIPRTALGFRETDPVVPVSSDRGVRAPAAPGHPRLGRASGAASNALVAREVPRGLGPRGEKGSRGSVCTGDPEAANFTAET